MSRFWPQSLKGQILLAIALALFAAQALSAVLLYRSQAERREAALIHVAAFRLLAAEHEEEAEGEHRPPAFLDAPRALRLEFSTASPLRPGEARDAGAEAELAQILSEMDFKATRVVVTRREARGDPFAERRLNRMRNHLSRPHHILVAGVERPGNHWLVARVVEPARDGGLVMTLIGQTLFIFMVIVGALALVLRRITRPLAALTGRVERFADTRDAKGQLEPEGPGDVRRLIEAHNAMEARIAALLDEKDVMLGAIGHDLKTPLAALRVRIESVEDDTERARMAGTIEDIVRTLDDILSLARVGRPRDPAEPTELSALVASVAEEFEDMEEPVELGDTVRIVLPLRATWLRRAIRNLVSNAVRYGQRARVTLAREAGEAVVRIEDDGPGIPDGEIARMQDPFARGDPSRNSATGGAGLGLALARAIAEQHGGKLRLVNRRTADGRIGGLTAEIRLPLISA